LHFELESAECFSANLVPALEQMLVFVMVLGLSMAIVGLFLSFYIFDEDAHDDEPDPQ